MGHVGKTVTQNVVSGSEITDGTVTGDDLASDIAISTSGAITTTGAFTSKGIDDNADATAMTIDSAENIGIGQAPETGHHSNWTAVDIGNRGGLAQYKTAGDVTLTYNLYHDGAWKAKETAPSGRYVIGATPYHIWYNGASASADASVTLTEVMRINEDGAVTKPLTPYFFGGKSDGQTGAGAVFISNVVEDNTGSHYDTSNGRFTAPVAGRYLCHFKTFSSPQGLSNGHYNAQLRINNSVISRFYFYHSGTHFPINWSCIVELNANDYVTHYLAGSLTVYGSDWHYAQQGFYLIG